MYLYLLTWNLLRRGPRKVVNLSLIWRAATVPEEHPLQRLIPFELVFEAKLVVLVRKLEQIQQLRRGLDAGERRGLRVVDEHGDAAVGVEAQEPLLFLLVGHDVDERGGPFGAVGVAELFEHDLRGLAIGRVLRNQVQAFCFGDLLGGFGDIEVVGHGAG